MNLDPENPVVRLCASGMEAETAGKPDVARAKFHDAWATRRDDFEGAIAAHYVARQEPTEADRLWWNLEALRLADRVGDAGVEGFYPSLLLNLGHSFEKVGVPDVARRCYEQASARLGSLPPGPYATMVTDGVTRALERSGPA